jgi:hypothetical protein
MAELIELMVIKFKLLYQCLAYVLFYMWSDNKVRELATMCLQWQHWTKVLVWFDDVDISAFHSCVVDLWQSLSDWHLLLSACVLVCRCKNVYSQHFFAHHIVNKLHSLGTRRRKKHNQKNLTPRYWDLNVPYKNKFPVVIFILYILMAWQWPLGGLNM